MNIDQINNVSSGRVAQATVQIMHAIQDFAPAEQIVAVHTMRNIMDSECALIDPLDVGRVADRVLHYHHDDPKRRAVFAYVREEIAKRV